MFRNSKIKSVKNPRGFEYMHSYLKNTDTSTMISTVTGFLIFLCCLSSVLANVHSHVDNEDHEIPKVRRRRAELLASVLGKGLIKERLTTDNRAMRFYRIRRKVKNGLIKAGLKVADWARRFFRVQRAKVIMKAGAILWKKRKDLRINLYFKPGGETRARKDLWMIDVYEIKLVKTEKQNYIYKGTVGDSIVEFRGQYSEKLPFPALVLYRKNSPERTRGTVLVVLYK